MSKAKRLSSHLTADDWVEAGIRRLIRVGIQGVEVLDLARDLGVTKGSFYWHFRQRSDLLRAILRRWRRVTVTFNEALNTEEKDASLRLRRLFHLPEETKNAAGLVEFERAVRSWSRHSPRVGVAVAEVDRLRHKMYVRLFRELGAIGGRADALSRISMAVAAQLWSCEDLNPKQRSKLIDTALALLIGVGTSEKGSRQLRIRQ